MAPNKNCMKTPQEKTAKFLLLNYYTYVQRSLPVRFAEVLKIVHIAARGWILSIHGFPLFSISDLYEIPMIFHYKFSSIKMFSSNYASPFAINVINLWVEKKISWEITKYLHDCKYAIY